MKYAHYNEETKEILGYYDDELHEAIPEPNINLSEEEWQDALSMGATHIKNNKPIHQEHKLSEAEQRLLEIEVELEDNEEFIRNAILIGNEAVLPELRQERKDLLTEREGLKNGKE